jgi:hypothetical protein
LFLPRARVREKNILASRGQKFTHKNSSFGGSDQAHRRIVALIADGDMWLTKPRVGGHRENGHNRKKDRNNSPYSSLIDRLNQWLTKDEKAAAKGREAHCPLKTQVSGTVP